MNGESILVFDIRDAADFDWLEDAILRNGYYEQPGVWNLGIDTDKQLMAEILSVFAPTRTLELGCAAGAVLQCLAELGVTAEGIEISETAVASAPPGVRERIHRGDLLALYLKRLTALAQPGAFFFCNIPAFGADPQFGTVFPKYVDSWDADAAAASLFRAIHTDELGFPMHGHLISAEWSWWVSQFEAEGLRREVEIERALHRKYHLYFERRSRARKAFFVFSRQADGNRLDTVIKTIRRAPSAALS